LDNRPEPERSTALGIEMFAELPIGSKLAFKFGELSF